MPNQTLKPCPFCTSQDVAIMREGKSDNNAAYRVVCRHCLTRGPKHWVSPWQYGNKFVAQGKAVADWNRMPRPFALPKTVNMPLSEIINSLEDQARDKDALVPADEPDSIFVHDATALRAAAKLLKKLEVRT